MKKIILKYFYKFFREIDFTNFFVEMISRIFLGNEFHEFFREMFIQLKSHLIFFFIPRYYSLTTKFSFEVKNVRAGGNVDEKVTKDFFRLKTPEPHRAIVALVKSIEGPQDIILELRMDMYHLGRYQASAIAHLYIFVTPFAF